MKKINKSILIIAVVLTAMTSFGQTVIMDNQVIKHDTIIQSERIVFRTGGKVRIKDGTHVTFIANVIEVQSAFVIDGRGEDGTSGAAGGVWQSTPSNGYDGPLGHVGHDGHAQWLTGCGDNVTCGARGNNGTNGGNGAIIFIQFHTYEGISGGLGSLNCLTAGGNGGGGGTGCILRCADHGETCPRPSGSNGVNGLPGKYTFQQL